MRSTPRRNKDGSEVRYLQLARNVWDLAAKRSRVHVVYSFGREEPGTREALERLVASVSRYLHPGRARPAEEMGFTESRPLGGTWALDDLWERLGIGPATRELLKGRRLDPAAERVLFALTANRALAPSSKLRRPLGVRGRAGRRAGGNERRRVLPGDGLAAGDPWRPGEGGLRPARRAAGHRNRLALLRHDIDLLRQGGGRRARCPRPAREPGPGRRGRGGEDGDRGFTSAENRRYLRSGGNRCIIGEKLRSGSAEAEAALSRQGRYQEVAGNLRVKEVRIAEDERFVICHNPDGAERDAATRARLIAQLKELIDGTDALAMDKRAELRGVISTKPGLNRYLRVTPGGLLRVDAGKAKAEENLGGKYLLRTSDPKMSAEDIALGYRQLLEVERGWRDMKQVIDLCPVDHRKEERIRAHVVLCWLALLLARVAESAAGQTWPEIRRQLDRIAAGTFAGPAGTFRQRTEIAPAQAAILEKLGIDPPPGIHQLTPAASR